MIFIILLIYFILLIIIEFFFICSTSNKKESITLENIENIDKFDFKKHKLEKEKSENDVDIKNFVGKFVIVNNYGFYINLDDWNLLQPKKLYEFKVPVNIKIIKIKNNEDIEYLLN
uniref:Uncharacterized protein n=1 Tax=viral metagenome TaxID=1070528 RepID=A0A6C0LFN5_9ZZZZ